MDAEDEHAGIPAPELAIDDDIEDLQFMEFLAEITADDAPQGAYAQPVSDTPRGFPSAPTVIPLPANAPYDGTYEL